ncbi:MAG TPA: prepilin-type N-terminal cleavage/methylation domain-containing protein [Gallionella sp.]|nr:prepilin-type N-terminal cleavage/methylation domain-containing protein [Gallionella sp.]
MARGSIRTECSSCAVVCTQSSAPGPRSSKGFTLVEMVMVIVITGIIGGMVAVFLKAPVQQYMDVARRADMTDIADTALRRIGRDLRLALPNSVRVTNSGGTVYLEYLETIAGGRYNTATTPADCLNSGNCTALTTTGNLVTGAAGTASTALANGGTITLNTSRVVVYNQYNNSANDCSNLNPSVYCAAASGGAPVITGVVNSAANSNEDQISFAAHTFLPAGGSPYKRFMVISQPVTYTCTPGGVLTRYWGYAIQPAQPTALATLTSANPGAVLATNVGATCNFTYDASVVAQRSGLVSVNLAITSGGETVTLYSATHVSNMP